MAGYSQGSGNTWDYAMITLSSSSAVVPMSGGYGSAGRLRAQATPAWAFGAADDTVVPYQNQVDTVNSINSCNPIERAKVTIFPSGGHDLIEEFMTIDLTGLARALPLTTFTARTFMTGLLAHTRQSLVAAVAPLPPLSR